MTIPPEILGLVEQLTHELDRIEQQASQGLAIATQLLEHFPNNADPTLYLKRPLPVQEGLRA
jgi:hypothetical protein